MADQVDLYFYFDLAILLSKMKSLFFNLSTSPSVTIVNWLQWEI